jgi:hypothetical protein
MAEMELARLASKRRLILGSGNKRAIFAGILLLSMACLMICLWRSLLVPDRFARLQLGMTTVEVSEVLHPRIAIRILSQDTEDRQIWSYFYSDGDLFPERLAGLTFEDGRLSAKKIDPLTATWIFRHWWYRLMN